MNVLPRKRKADEFVGPDEFLEQYFKERRIAGDLTSDVTRAIDRRANDARERFKQLRDSTTTNESANENPQLLSPGKKYIKRLENNRKSAAASKVYNEVRKVEISYALLKLVKLIDCYKSQVTDLTAKLHHSERNVLALRERNTQLEAELASKESHTVDGQVKGRSNECKETNEADNSKLVSDQRPPVFAAPLTPKTAEHVISTALKLPSAALNTNPGGSNGIGLNPTQGSSSFEMPKCGEPSPDSSRNETLFCF